MVKNPFFKNNLYYKGPDSDHFQNQRFFNPIKPEPVSLFAFLSWLINKKSNWKPIKHPKYFTPPARVEGDELRVTSVGHNTFLLQTQGLNILTDPIWAKRASPFSFIGPKRAVPPGIKFSELPTIDIVWISHNHYDHLDLNTVEKLWKKFKPRIITPLGNDTIIKSKNPNIKCEAYDWYETVKINEKMVFKLGPMQHWSTRKIYDRNMALWAALTIKIPVGDIFFIGDTGYGDGTTFTKADSSNLRLAILPMGAYEPRFLTQYSHMSPKEFHQAYLDLNKPFTIPSHYDVFPLANEKQYGALEYLDSVLENTKSHNIKILEPGTSCLVPPISN